MSMSPSSSAGDPVVAALDGVAAAVDGAAEAVVWSLSDEVLLAAVEAAERQAARLAELGLRLVREAAGRDLGRRAGAASTAAPLRARLRLRPGQARARVALAGALAGRQDRPLPATQAGLAAGAVSVEQAHTIHRAVADLPAGTPRATVGAAEALLIRHAATFDANELARLGEHLRHVLETAQATGPPDHPHGPDGPDGAGGGPGPGVERERRA
jgi:hypothetical protein